MPGLLRHVWRYSFASTLGTLASLISFPVLTRLLHVEDYGLMSTVALALSLLVAFGKLGLQKVVVLHFHEAQTQEDGSALRRLVATTVYGMLGVGLATTLIWSAGVAATPAGWLGDPRLKGLLLLSAFLILIRVGESACSNLLYAQERSGALSMYNVVKRYAVLLLVIGALLLIHAGADVFFAATLVGEALALAALIRVVHRGLPIVAGAFSRQLFVSMAAVGLPMVGMELAWLLLAMGDRYVIQRLLGAEAVGVYSASYNLCEYIKVSTLAAAASAALPAFMRIRAQQGREATESFVRGYGRAHFAFALLLAALVSASAAPLITILASARYLAGTVVVPWIMLGLALESYVTVATAGLILKKRTGLLFALAGFAALLNLALNFLLLPLMGLVGSAIATLVSFALLLACTLIGGRGELSIGMPWRTIAAGLAGFGVACGLALLVDTGHPLVDLLVRSALVAGIYVPWMWLADAPLRADVKVRLPGLWRRLRGS